MAQAGDSLELRNEATAYPARGVAWYAVSVLALLYLVSILDRFIITLLVEPIKRDLGIDDVQFGMLHGLAFALTFSLFGLILGTLADRTSRRWVIFTGVTIWSLATALCGFAQKFWHLLLARVGVGVGEAALNPCATSMITDLFPRERLTTAMAIYGLGATLGSGCAYFFGGVIVDLVAKTDTIVAPVLGTIRSWQAVFLIVGIPGMLLALLIFTLPEPVRRGFRNAGQRMSWGQSYRELFKLIAARARFFVCHYSGFTIASAVVAGGGTWYPAHLGRTFAWTPTQIGLSLGLTLTLAGIASQVISGHAIDALFRRGIRDAQIRWYAGCMVLATPTGIIAMTSSSPWVFLVCLGLFLTMISSLPTCAATALNLVTPNELRGTGIALFTSIGGLIGSAAGPMLIPLFAKKLFGGPADIGLGMAVLIAICCPLAAILLSLAFRSMREAVADADRWAN